MDLLKIAEERIEELEEREQMITAEIQKLKAELEEQKEKTKAAEEIANKALELGMKATKKWEKEKSKRKMAEEVLQGLQSILHDSVTAGLIPRYKRKPSVQMEAPVQEEYYDVEEAPLLADIQAEEVQVKVEEVQVKVEEQVQTPVSAEDVILYHELKIVQMNNIQWFTTDLVKAHCESRGISTNGKQKAQMLQELKDALNGTPSPLINVVGLLDLYEKKQQEHDFKLSDITILRLHCRYHGLSTIGKQKVALRETLRIHLG